MTKSVKLIVILLVAGIFIYCVYLAVGQKKPTLTSTQSSDTLSIPTQSGDVSVRNFTKTPARLDGDTTVIAENNNYSIVYFAKDQSFLITILSEPVQQNRDSAETALLQQLNISQASACNLTVALTVPFSVDESLAGQDYGLSFCPTGRPF